MAAPDRWVVFDDSDTSQIQYGSGWEAVTPDQGINGLGNFGVPFRNSLHALRRNGSFTFKFNGTSIDVYGTTTKSRAPLGDDPSYECIVDNISLKLNPPLLFDENNWSLCSTNALGADREHTLEITVKIKSNIFYFDRLQYAPSNEADFNATTISLFDSRHPSVMYDSSWTEQRGIVNSTNTNGGKATVSFVGKSFAWFGVVPGPDPPINQTSGTYAVDGGTPVQFLLRGLPEGGMEQFNQQFFQTPQLSQGPHTVEVVYGGNNDTTPLVLDYFVVEHDIIPPSSPSNGGSGNNPDNPHDTQSSEGAPVGAIVGAIIGVVALISMVVLVFLHFRRQSRAKSADLHRNNTMDTHMSEYAATPYHDSSFPSTGYPNSATSLPIAATDAPSQGPTSTSKISIISRSPPSSSTDTSFQRHGFSSFAVPNQIGISDASASRSSGAGLPSRKGVAAMGGVTRMEYTPEADTESTFTTPGKQAPVAVRHKDSGMRLNIQSSSSQAQRVVELPPTYTPA